jgi:hypothetical protein
VVQPQADSQGAVADPAADEATAIRAIITDAKRRGKIISEEAAKKIRARPLDLEAADFSDF